MNKSCNDRLMIHLNTELMPNMKR